MTTNGYSIDGRRFTLEAPLDEALPIGSYVQLDTRDGRSYLGQLLDVDIVRGVGVSASEPMSREIRGRGVLLSRLDGDGPGRATSADVFAAASVVEADPQVVSAHLGSWTQDASGIHLGELSTIDGVPAALSASGFGRHTFLCGQSGSGKTYTLGRILEQLLLETDIRIAVFDPNSDYVNVGALREREETGLDPAEYEELADRYMRVASQIKVYGGPDAPSALRARFGRLTPAQQATVLGVDPIADPEEFNAFIRTVEDIPGEDYTIDALIERLRQSFAEDERRLGMRIANLGIAGLSIWARGDTPSIRETLPDDWRALVFDLGSLPSDRERAIASAAALGHFWAQRAARQPLLLVIDEAHNICPQVPMDANQELATEHAIRIAGEGRKYGLYLILASQRPEKIHENVLSQCDNLLLMRMNSTTDIEHLKRTFSFAPPALIEQATGFRLGEGLAVGKIAPDPIRFATGRRYTREGGADVPADWARRR
ncbi:MAG: ATP-binding protein [Thermoleophilia bacterium]|nr:ATP-binding protein [Thermoleophilia bacterium]MDH3725203.1 ATP-binding protein [Thermoleophilia bacterium]